jgi:hypothetical protein
MEASCGFGRSDARMAADPMRVLGLEPSTTPQTVLTLVDEASLDCLPTRGRAVF